MPVRKIALPLFAICVAAIAPASAQQPNWQKQVESSIADVAGPGQVKCPELYASTQTRCQFEGGRSCLMQRAIEAAKRGDCARAVWLRRSHTSVGLATRFSGNDGSTRRP